MESKLLVGGKSIIDKTSEQERALEERRKQIAEQQVMTELLSSKFRSLMILNKSALESEGSPSVRNKITRFLLFPAFLETEPFSNWNAFSKAGMNLV